MCEQEEAEVEAESNCKPCSSKVNSNLDAESEAASSSESTDNECPENDETKDEELAFMRVQRASSVFKVTEQDEQQECAKRLRVFLRDRPTLPASLEDTDVSYKDVHFAYSKTDPHRYCLDESEFRR